MAAADQKLARRAEARRQAKSPAPLRDSVAADSLCHTGVVISRRSLLLWPPALAAAQSRRPDILLIWTTLRSVPAGIARESIVFPRAYAASPQPELARRAIETGKFPLAIRPGDSSLPFRQLTAHTAEEAVRMAATLGPGSILVFTAAGSILPDSPREDSIRVPLAIRYPGIVVARNAPEILISHVDLAPTLLALAGSPVPIGVNGRNLSQLLAGKRGEVPDSIFVQGRQWRAAVRGYDKIVIDPDEEILGLFNLADDPEEQSDLSRDPAHERTRNGMLALARVWMQRLGDGWSPTGARLRRTRP